MPPVKPKQQAKLQIDDRWKLLHGNCKDVLPTLPAMSIDSVVTDPPYGLSAASGLQSDSDCVFNTLRNIGFPKLYKWDVKSGKKGDLSSIVSSSLPLGGVNRTVGVKPGVGMPKRPVNLKGDTVVQKKVHTGSVPSGAGVSDSNLRSEIDSEFGEFIGDFLLKLRDVNPVRSSRHASDSCLAEVFAGGFAVPISPVLPSDFPCLEGVSVPVSSGDENVGLSNDSRRQPGSSAGVVTPSGAVNTFMLRFELSRGPVELKATYRASAENACLEESRSELVRASSTTSCLATVAKSHRVCFVVPLADGTDARYWFHLWTPRALNLDGIVPTGGFMGKSWDSTLPDPEVWRAILRVLKPGGHLLAFSGTRTYHKMVQAIEDAGFEVREMLCWVYSTGFPKSHNVSKGIDKMYGHERNKKVFERKPDMAKSWDTGGGRGFSGTEAVVDTPISEEAETWDGFGSALKPSLEPICLAMRPLIGPIQRNIREYGTGALNIEKCRIGTEGGTKRLEQTPVGPSGSPTGGEIGSTGSGRWPANLLHDGSEEVLDLFPKTGASKSASMPLPKTLGDSKGGKHGDTEASSVRGFDEPAGLSAARFFYCSKASALDRDEGLESFEVQNAGAMCGRADGTLEGGIPQRKNIHTTVKPTNLMRWLIRLITPPGGTVLDPFTGSGSTGKACGLEGFRFTGIEMTEEYIEIARKRIAFGYANFGKS